MQDSDKFSFYQSVEAMFEATGKQKPSPSALRFYWDTMNGFELKTAEDAISRAVRELKWPAKPSELRDFARDVKFGVKPGGISFRCHFHGDGEHEHPKVGRPNEPSKNPTMWWCDRCTYFVQRGQQAADPPHRAPTVRAIVKAIAHELDKGPPDAR